MQGEEGRKNGARSIAEGLVALGSARRGRFDRVDPQLCRRALRDPIVRAAGLLAMVAVIAIAVGHLAGAGDLLLAIYPMLHAFLDTCSIAVCAMIFFGVLADQTVLSGRRNRTATMLGAAFLAVALLDFAHGYSETAQPGIAAIDLWLAARLVSASALLSAALFDPERTIAANRTTWWTAGSLAVASAAAWIIFERQHGVVSALGAPGSTTARLWTHVGIISICIFAATSFCRRIATTPATQSGGTSAIALMCAAIFLAASEVLVALPARSGVLGVIGHALKLVTAWFVYRGLAPARVFEAEIRAKLALGAAQLGTWSWEPETDTLDVDTFAATLWGLSGAHRTTLSAIEPMIHPDDRAARLKAVERAIDPAGDGSYFAEFRIVGADGTTRHIVSRGATEFRLGKPVRVIGVVRDDTRQREASTAEHRSEARLSGILSIAADAIISIDEWSRIVLFNQGAEKVFGYASADTMGKPLEMLLPERFRSSHGGHIQRFAASGITAQRMGERGEVAGLRKDGTEFPAEASISKLIIDGTTTFTVVLRDVTDRKRLEMELERRVVERTAELSALLDAVPDGIVQTDNERRIRMPNAAMSQLFGYRREELIGKPSSVLYGLDIDNAAVDAAWRSVDAGQAFETLTLECRRKDGSAFTAMVRGSVVRDDKGRVMSRVGMIRDVTGEMERQKALSVAQRMEAFGQLTGGIAHDFNNLLTVITGNLELLEMRLQDERQVALLHRAQAAAEMGARLTSRLLTFARRRQFSTSLLSLNEQITQMVDLLRRSIGEQITLTTNLSPKLPLVKADPSEVENAVLNLAINARDAMPSGGTIVIETSEHIVDGKGLSSDVRLKPGHYVRLSVTDTGSGMSPDVVSRAFEPFYTTKPHGKGTGLGLSTIHGFAQQSGGTATLYSEPGMGTTVSIYLPRVDEDGHQATLGLDDETLPLSAGERVLLVEDNPEVRNVARQLLEGLGYKVEEVHSGAAAIEELKGGGAAKYDIVFCDVVMPGGASGFDVARWVDANAPELRVLLTSGYPDEVASGDNGNLAGLPLLRKPYSRVELARSLRQVLDR